MDCLSSSGYLESDPVLRQLVAQPRRSTMAEISGAFYATHGIEPAVDIASVELSKQKDDEIIEGFYIAFIKFMKSYPVDTLATELVIEARDLIYRETGGRAVSTFYLSRDERHILNRKLEDYRKMIGQIDRKIVENYELESNTLSNTDVAQRLRVFFDWVLKRPSTRDQQLPSQEAAVSFWSLSTPFDLRAQSESGVEDEVLAEGSLDFSSMILQPSEQFANRAVDIASVELSKRKDDEIIKRFYIAFISFMVKYPSENSRGLVIKAKDLIRQMTVGQAVSTYSLTQCERHILNRRLECEMRIIGEMNSTILEAYTVEGLELSDADMAERMRVFFDWVLERPSKMDQQLPTQEAARGWTEADSRSFAVGGLPDSCSPSPKRRKLG